MAEAMEIVPTTIGKLAFYLSLITMVAGLNAQTRLGYGMAFEELGRVTINTNTYDGLIEIPLDWYNLQRQNHTLTWRNVCKKTRSGEPITTRDEYILCQGVWPLFVSYEQRTYAKELQVYEKLAKELPALMPGIQLKIPEPREPVTERGFSNADLRRIRQSHLEEIRRQGKLVTDELETLQTRLTHVELGEVAAPGQTDNGEGKPLWIRLFANRGVVENLDLETLPEELTILRALAQATINLRAFQALDADSRACMCRNTGTIWKGRLKTKIEQLIQERTTIQDTVKELRGAVSRQSDKEAALVQLLSKDRRIWKEWIQELIDEMSERAESDCKTEANEAAMTAIVQKLRLYNNALRSTTGDPPLPAPSRTKRSLGPLNLIWNIADSITSAVHRRKMTKAIQQVQRDVKSIAQEVTNIRSEFLVIFRKQITELNNIKADIKETREHILTLFDSVTKLQSWTTFATDEIAQLHMADYFLIDVFGQIIPLMELELELLDAFQQAAAVVTRAIGSMQQKRLSPELVKAHELQKVLTNVQAGLKRRNRQFDLLFPEAADYYGLPLTNFAYTNESVFLWIPIYLRHFQQPEMQLYRIHSVPVPYNENNTNTEMYTRVHHEKPYLASSKIMYTEMTQTEVDKCEQQAGQYVCPQVSLIRTQEHHTCTSAILNKQPHEKIRQKCQIELMEQRPEPEVLDFGDTILIANVPGKWRFECGKEEHVPRMKQTSELALIPGNVICDCNLQIGEVTIPAMMDKCDDQDSRTIKVTQNLAVQGYIHAILEAIKQATPGEGPPAQELHWEEFQRTFVPPTPGELRSEDGTDLDYNLNEWAAKDKQWKQTNSEIQDREILKDETDWFAKLKTPMFGIIVGFAGLLGIIGSTTGIILCCKLRRLPTVLELGKDLEKWPETMRKLKRAKRDVLETVLEEGHENPGMDMDSTHL